jgi:kinesin family protein C2/C3
VKKNNDPIQGSSINKLTSEQVPMSGSSDIDNYSNIQSEIITLRTQLRNLRRLAVNEFKQLPKIADNCLFQVGDFMKIALKESENLKDKLALEASCRRKLLHELQDLRGNIRTYCRPKPVSGSHSPCIMTSPVDDVCVLNGDIISDAADDKFLESPMRFEFDKVFPSETSQKDVYAELEGTIIDVLDGFNVCVISYGPTGCGKTFSILGDVEVQVTSSSTEVSISNPGVSLLAVEQLFAISQHRSDTFKDSFTLSLLEVYNEKLLDLIGSTSSTAPPVEGNGKNPPQKLEIKTNQDGDTVVQGLINLPLSSYEDFVTAWTDAIQSRVKRLHEEGVDVKAYEASCHTIATVHVMSTSISSGVTTVGRIHFVDLAASDAVIRRNSVPTKPRPFKTLDILAPVGNTQEWKFMNKSISVLADVATSRAQFSRNVPYRNSTITHMLRDSLEADTKVILLLCVGCEYENLQVSIWLHHDLLHIMLH